MPFFFFFFPFKPRGTFLRPGAEDIAHLLRFLLYVCVFTHTLRSLLCLLMISLFRFAFLEKAERGLLRTLLSVKEGEPLPCPHIPIPPSHPSLLSMQRPAGAVSRGVSPCVLAPNGHALPRPPSQLPAPPSFSSHHSSPGLHLPQTHSIPRPSTSCHAAVRLLMHLLQAGMSFLLQIPIRSLPWFNSCLCETFQPPLQRASNSLAWALRGFIPQGIITMTRVSHGSQT